MAAEQFSQTKSNAVVQQNVIIDNANGTSSTTVMNNVCIQNMIDSVHQPSTTREGLPNLTGSKEDDDTIQPV